MLYMFYITTTPYLLCNKSHTTRKELYDFYYTLVTLTTGYVNSSYILVFILFSPATKGAGPMH